MSNSISTTGFERAEQLRKSFTEYANALGVDAVARLCTIYFSSDQAGIFQDFQVLRNRCLGQWHDVDNLTTNASAAKREGL